MQTQLCRALPRLPPLWTQDLAPDSRASEGHLAPLHGAVRTACAVRVAMLLRHGANPRARWQGKDAFDLAREQGLAEILTLLEANSR